MDLGSIIIGAILIAVCTVPLVIMNRNGKKRERQALKSLTNIANQQNCSISKYEACGDFVIGMDEIKNFVFFYKQKNEETISHCVDLSEIHICRAVKTRRTVKSKGGSEDIIERIKLSLIPKNKEKAEVKFELYGDEDTQLNGELQLVDRWAKQINEHLKSK